jgi:hypothetical protein
VRRHATLGALFGAGGRKVPLVTPALTRGAPDEIGGRGPKAWLRRLRRAEFGQQDKCLGLAELVAAIRADRPHFPPTDFTLHVTELTLAIQAAGPDGASHTPGTRFAPLPRPPGATVPRYADWTRPGPVPRLLSGLIGGLGARRS